MTPLLLPAPRELHLHEHPPIPVPRPVRTHGIAAHDQYRVLTQVVPCQAAATKDAAWLRVQVVAASNGPAEHYHLTIAAHGVDLRASDQAGVRAGLTTLAQLIHQFGATLPCLEIRDHPAFPVRGVMLDVSRDRIPTMNEARRIITLLASLKINHVQFYTEHSFAYHGHQTVWNDASPLTGDEIDALVGFAADHGITVAANQNCFGHMERWLKHPAYRHLAEAEEWTAFGQVRRYPFTLCPGDPGSLALVKDLLGQLLPHFPSRLVNVGCDETFDLGQGRSQTACQVRGKAAVYLEFLDQVCGVARSHGHRPMYWADIALEHPEALPQTPSDAIALAWNYEANAAFAAWCRSLRAAGRTVWVCPGTSSWCSIVGRTAVRRANLLAATRDGLAEGATGFLVTDWGDGGHRQTWPITAIGLAEAAHRAWSGVAPYDARAASLHVFADAGLTLAPWLEALGDCDQDLRLMAGKDDVHGQRQPLLNRSALYQDLHLPYAEPWIGSSDDWRQTVQRIQELVPPQGVSDLQTWRECRHTWRMADFAARRALARRDGSRPCTALANELAGLMDEHRDLWLRRSRPGGLLDSLAHYERVRDDLRAAQS